MARVIKTKNGERNDRLVAGTRTGIIECIAGGWQEFPAMAIGRKGKLTLHHGNLGTRITAASLAIPPCKEMYLYLVIVNVSIAAPELLTILAVKVLLLMVNSPKL